MPKAVPVPEVIEILDDSDSGEDAEHQQQQPPPPPSPSSPLPKQEETAQPSPERPTIPTTNHTPITTVRLPKYPSKPKETGAKKTPAVAVTNNNNNNNPHVQEQQESNNAANETIATTSATSTAPAPNDTVTSPPFRHALLDNNQPTTVTEKDNVISRHAENSSHVAQQPQDNQSIQVPAIDPLYENDAYLSTIEMEVLMLAEESLYCWDTKQIDTHFLWEYATPQLRIRMRNMPPQNNNNENQHQESNHAEAVSDSILLQQLLQDRWNDALIRARFDWLRQQYRQKLRQGFRRPLMAPVIANTRLLMIRGQRPHNLPKPNIDAILAPTTQATQPHQSTTQKKQKLAHPLAKITVESPPRPSKRLRDDTTSHIQRGTNAATDMLDVHTGKVIRTFSSIREVERETGLHREVVKAAIQSGKIVKGFRWKLRQDEDKDNSQSPAMTCATPTIAATKPPPISNRGSSSFQIETTKPATPRAVDQIDLKTGEILKTFTSVSQAAMYCSLAKAKIEPVLRGEKPSAGGFGWQFSSHPVIEQVDLKTGNVLKTFLDTTQAAIHCHLGKAKIEGVLRKNASSAGGFGWRYSIPVLPPESTEASQPPNSKEPRLASPPDESFLNEV